jgi:aminoglycoside phosphotransferase (APT) family kinase protein
VSDDLADRLLCVLRERTGTPALEYEATPVRLTGGFWAELLAFELRRPPPGWEGPLVARVMPDPATARKETIVQSVVADAGVPTPRVRAAGGPEDGLGRAFMVMDRVDGVPLLAGLESTAGLLGAPRRLGRMPDMLASLMAQLHAIDPRPVRDELAAVEGIARTLPELLASLQSWSASSRRDDLVAAAGWLITHPIHAGDVAICHGDLHPFNVLVDGAGHPTVLDWSTAVLAPRAYDAAFTTLVLSNPPLVVPAPARPLVALAGRGLARRFLHRYQRHSGYMVEEATLAWFQAVVCLRALAEAASWVHAGVVDSRRGHPWLVSGSSFASHLGAVTGVAVRPL